MSWEEVELPAVVLGEPSTCSLRFTAAEVCVVEVRQGEQLAARGEGPDLFEALVAARRVLEQQGTLVGCNGSRRDVLPSPMLRQTASGRRAYVLGLPRGGTRPPTVDIFDLVPDLSMLATVDEQRAWFDSWWPPEVGREASV